MKIPKEIIRQREKDAWDLRLKNVSQEDIALHLGISQSGVSKLLKRLSQRYIKALDEDIEQIKGEQIAQLENVAREAYAAWERSKEPSKTAWVKQPISIDGSKLPGGKQNVGEQTKEVRDQDGDPRYLTVYMKAKEDIRKIVGADAPIRNINLDLDVTKLTDDELRDLASGKSISRTRT